MHPSALKNDAPSRKPYDSAYGGVCDFKTNHIGQVALHSQWHVSAITFAYLCPPVRSTLRWSLISCVWSVIIIFPSSRTGPLILLLGWWFSFICLSLDLSSVFTNDYFQRFLLFLISVHPLQLGIEFHGVGAPKRAWVWLTSIFASIYCMWGSKDSRDEPHLKVRM